MKKSTAAALSLALTFMLSSGAFGASSSMATASNSSGGVTVKVTYRAPQQPNELRFDVSLDANAVDLDRYDLEKLTLLRDAKGKTYEPVKVEAKGSGRHRSAVMIFPEPAGGSQKVDLIVKDIADVNERVFNFQIG